MNENHSKRRLGRGLAALIGEIDRPFDNKNRNFSVNPDSFIPIEFISSNLNNPRSAFNEEELQDLAQSIRRYGIVQPVIVRTLKEDSYEIIAGERRWRAAQLSGLLKIPVIIRDVDEKTALEIAIVENVQRKDLNPIEEALGYEKLIAEYEYTQNDLGEIIGKSRSHISNILRLLKLPDSVKELLVKGELSLGHARSLILTPDPASLAKIVVSKGMSVRDTEILARNSINKKNNQKDSSKNQRKKDDTIILFEQNLSDKLNLKVQINTRNSGGEICIYYKSIEDLEKIYSLLGRD
ncbi:Chromosome (plasmid) partitioning protein ParB / Stage 0 sporulation protein J [Liberibacter crescens BT-1]|uniref:Chromosome (Plasmid) partitioning protein ParB / Stage 0 sporulation protein J n=1 Tax=Liberibacter crescens (strain BT-1) TaxID=1215343 RepID=L0ESU9_LIBCB|nr:ParB/RepB/Spo0J family partition protein [Liberibacter crescens]AGA63997.1 Chromosome (plasmid) partitioning protein ParB / Stage 0 sporulation protein J [Liberibacter crescens BT-1]AMC12309.1 chromosome partitioning protein ParB [Liberibacter crescens]